MADFMVSYIWRTPDYGWTENYFATGANSTAILERALDPFFLENMVNWRGGGVTLQGVTVTEEGGLRKGSPRPINRLSPRGTASPKDARGTSIKVKLLFTGGGSRTLDVRGAADSDIVPSSTGPSTVVGQTLAGIIGMCNLITATANPFRGRKLVDIVAEEWKTALSLQPHALNPQWTRINVLPIETLPEVRDEVYFRGYNRATQAWLKGYFRVVDVDVVANWFAIPALFQSQISPLTPRNIQWREAIYEYPTFINNNNEDPILYVSTRDTAGPFRRGRGRRSAVSLRR